GDGGGGAVTGAVVDDPDRRTPKGGTRQALQAGEGDVAAVPVEHDDGDVGGREAAVRARLRGADARGAWPAAALAEGARGGGRRGVAAPPRVNVRGHWAAARLPRWTVPWYTPGTHRPPAVPACASEAGSSSSSSPSRTSRSATPTRSWGTPGP